MSGLVLKGKNNDWEMIYCNSEKSGATAKANFKFKQYKLGVPLNCKCIHTKNSLFLSHSFYHTQGKIQVPITKNKFFLEGSHKV